MTALLLAGAALRFSALDRWDLWYDEAFVLARAESSDWRTIAFGPPGEVEPPLYHAALHGWLALHGGGPVPSGGDGGASTARAFSALTSTGLLVVAAALYRRMLPPGAALAALALLALSPVQLVYAHEARPHALRALLELLAVLALLAPGATTRPWGWAAALAAAALTHSLALLAWPAMVAWHGLAGPRARIGRVRIIAGLAVAAAPLALFALFVSPGMRDAITAWQASEPRMVGVVAWSRGFLEALGPGAWAPAGSVWVFAGLIAAGLVATRRELRRPGPAVLWCCALIPPFMLYGAHRAGVVSHPRPRYVLPAQPMLLGLAARGALALPHPFLRVAALTAGLGVEVQGVARYLAGRWPVLDQPPFRKPLRAVAGRITAQARPGDLVLCRDVTTAEPLRRYLPAGIPVAFVQGIGGETAGEARMHGPPVAPSRALREARRVWFIVATLRWNGEPEAPDWAAVEFRGAAREEEFRMPGVLMQRWRRR